MSSIERKLKRKREKEQIKEAKKQLQEVTDAMSSLPTACTECSTDFDLVRDADTWIADCAGGVLRLVCEKCAPSLSAAD